MRSIDPNTRYPVRITRLLLLSTIGFCLVVMFVLLCIYRYGDAKALSGKPYGAVAPYVAPPTSSPTSSPTPNCQAGWSTVLSPDGGTNNELLGMAAVDTNDIWAAGYRTDPSDFHETLIEHWDGSAWSVVPSPDEGTTSNDLYGVAALSANNVWAVGSYRSDDAGVLIEHWDGSVWSVVPGPPNVFDMPQLHGIAAVSTDDIWAAGYYNLAGTVHALTIHWDGNTWQVVPTPDLGTTGSMLKAIVAVSADNVWAVGGKDKPSGNDPVLILHWDGHSWSVLSTPDPVGLDDMLNGISALSPTDIWAVGYSYGPMTVLIYHWDGTSWEIVPGADILGQWDQLSSVAVIAGNDVWAVGSTQPDYVDPLIEHWDGSVWSVVPGPDPGVQGSTLNTVVAVSPTLVWAAGFYNANLNHTFLERYIDPCPPPPTSPPSNTPPPGVTYTPIATHTPHNTATPTITPTPQLPRCPGEHFTDVCPTDYFYPYVQALTNDGILSGYNTSPPCLNSLWIPCFNPQNSSTRGQISKVVSLAANFNDPVTGQTFEDVRPGSTFYTYTERMAERGIITGYPCGGPGEPCVPPGNRAYFRTNNKVTRAQLSKMVVNAFGWSEPITGQQFQDVPPENIFYNYIGRLYGRGIISGYLCGTPPAGPCVPPDSLPYFLPGNNVTRGQTAKIVQLARTQPSATPTAMPTSTPISTIASTPSATPTGCRPSWTVIPSPNQGSSAKLDGVAAIAADNVWAVGEYNASGRPQTLVEHWNGTSWSVVPSPNIGTPDNYLNGIAAVGPNDIWAAGYYYTSNNIFQTLIEHWNGTSWSVVSSPNAGTTSNFLQALATVSANDVWAVGETGTPGVLVTLVEHWNGTSWLVVPSPNPGPNINMLHSVAAVSANDVWAVGEYAATGIGPGQTLVEHWNGTWWSVVPSPSPGNGGDFAGVAALSANDVWAVGEYDGSTTLVERWDGISWQIVASPNPVGANLIFLTGIAVVASSDVWAVGSYSSDGGQTYATLVEHYMGCTATPTSTPFLTISPTSISAPTQTPTNPDCQGIPPSQDMQITPGNCGPIGTTFTFLGSGFQPNESVHLWLTAPDGTVLGSPQPFPADNNGDVGPLPLTTDPSIFVTGLWALTLEGVTSRHQAIGYFMVLPAYAPKQSH